MFLNIVGRDLDSEDVRTPLREIGIDFPHEIGHMVAAHGAIVEGKNHFVITL